MIRITKIGESEMHEAGVASLSSRPSSPKDYGGDGLSPRELKERFDRLPRLIAARVNLLITLLTALPELSDLSGGSAAELLLTGMFPGKRDGHTLAMLLRELLDGSAADYIGVGQGKSLASALAEVRRLPKIVSEGEQISLGDGTEVRAGRIRHASVTLPLEPGEHFSAALVFESLPEKGATEIAFPAGVLWSGDDVAEGEFVPREGKHYTVWFWYDGAYQAAVRGVSYA